MAKLINFEVVKLPKVIIIGKEIKHRFDLMMKGDNPIPAFWGKCFEENVFGILEAQKDFIYNADYVGVMCDFTKGDGEFSYIIGMIMKEGATVPDGFRAFVIEEGDVGIGYVKGEELDVSMNAHRLTEEAIKNINRSNHNMEWFMELYNCPRWTDVDQDGHRTMDYYIPLD
ncbi:MAG TPA: GyrI-like domain-containing protein [Acholeplasma sp.]|nr:GyrI-like domain-containing protein [Acholeplasma sp.]